MRLLLDTCTLLWAAGEPERLSARAAGLLADPTNEMFVSVASFWEIVIKYNRGRLDLAAPPDEWFRASVTSRSVLDIEVEDIEAVYRLGPPAGHSDPFDRLLVGTAQRRGLVVVTPDRSLQGYEVRVEW
jgi:PIN domain nuclease of toxin-antitoxin system